MKKLALVVSFLFTFGQVLMPNFVVSASTLTNKNEEAIIENIDTNSNLELKDEVKDNINEDNQNTNEDISKEVFDQVNNEERLDEIDNVVNESEENNSEVIINNEEVETDLDNSEADIDSEEDTKEINSNDNLEEIKFGDVYETIKKPMQATISTFSVEETDIHYSREEYAGDMNSLQDIEYLVNKTDSNFEVVLSMGDGVYQYVDSVDTIEEAISLANSNEIISDKAYKAKSVDISNAIPAVIDSNGVIVYSTNAMGRILKHINGEPYYYSNIVTYLYRDYSSTSWSNYINQGYVDDVPIIEDRGNRAKIQVSGYIGWINKDTSLKEYDMIVVPLNNVKNPSYYENVNGELYHWISEDITTEGEGSNRVLGIAPSFMKQGVRYYSYDGNYFYTDLNTLISDLKAGHKNNSVNSNEAFYFYYQILPFRSQTVYSAAELDRFIADKTETNSKLRGTGQAFINAQNKYGVNAVTMLGIAINESKWGTSNLALTKNNLFGLKAYDSNPNDAEGFSSVEQCINEFAEYWISKGYADPQDDRYYGGFLGGKNLGANVKYASDPFWGEKAASNAYANDRYLSGGIANLRDYNSNIIGIFTAPTTVIKSDGSSLYSITSTLEYNASYVGAPIVINSTNKQSIGGKSCYSVNPDRTTALPLSGGSEFIGTYDWNIKGYVDSNSVKLLNTKVITGISYKAHVRNIGWQGVVSNGEISGTTGRNLGIEALVINLENMPSGTSIRYRAHVQDIGWQNWVSGGQVAGTEGKAKNMEAIQIESSGMTQGNTIQYRVHIQDLGWQEWKNNGEIAGTEGQNKKIEAIEIRIVKTDYIDVLYNSHIQDDGWLKEVSSGISGTEGKNRQMEATTIRVDSNISGVGIKYRAHVQDIGWQNWVSNGAVAGTEGMNKQMEAIQIMLTGAPKGYSVEYRVHVQDIGWQNWVRDGQIAGTEGKNKQIEAIEIRIVKTNYINVLYKAHVQNDGWLKEVSSGIAGTEGKNKQLEALTIRLDSNISGIGIKYRAHVQDIGWQGWVSNGIVAGTEGKNKHMEAIEIQLTGAPNGYHVEYRVHIEDIGWQGWVRDGQLAGTTGKNKQIEAIEIRIVKD